MAQIQKRPKKTQSQDDKKKKKILIGCLCGVGAAALIAGVTIPLVMCSPLSKVTVNFVANDETETISVANVKIKKDSTWAEVKSQSFASKTTTDASGNQVDWLFLGWYEDGDEEKTILLDDVVVSEEMTVHPLFEQPAPGEIVVNFTPDPNDSEGVQIDNPACVIPVGTTPTFAQIKDYATAVKIVDGVKWDFQWWYRDGHDKTREMSKDLVITETLTVHPYFTAPKVVPRYDIYLSAQNDVSGVTITGGTHFVVPKGTLLKDLFDENEISATKKDVGEIKYDLQYWTTSSELIPDSEREWIPPGILDINVTKVDEFLDPDGDKKIYIYPYFIEREIPWRSKVVFWEPIYDEEGEQTEQTYSKDFVLDEGVIQFSSSHFIFANNEGKVDSLNPITLQKDEEVYFEPIVTEAGWDPNAITAEVQGLDDPSAPIDRQNVLFKIDKTKIPTGWGSTPVHFNINWEIWYKDVKQTFNTLQGFTFTLTPEYVPASAHYSSNADETFITEPGVKTVFVDSEKRDQEGQGYFYLDKPLLGDEILEAEVTGINKDNILIDCIDTKEVGNKCYINFNIGFKTIDGIGLEHIADFAIVFHVVRDSLGSDNPSDIKNNFHLLFTPDPSYPYVIALNAAYSNKDTLSTTIDIDAQIEYSEHEGDEGKPVFRSTDYVTATNVDREKGNDNPVYFATPQEKDYPHARSEDLGKVVPLYGNDKNHSNISIQFYFDTPPETDWEGDVNVRFDFFTSDGVQINPVERKIHFTYHVKPTLDYTNDSWASTHSFGIVQTAQNKKTKKTETRLGTGWIISVTPNYEEPWNSTSYFMVTSNDVAQDYWDFNDATYYQKQTFGLVCTESAKQHIQNDSTKYVLLDNAVDSIEPIADNNDVLELKTSHDVDPGSRCGIKFNHIPQYWKLPSLIGRIDVGPSLVVSEIDFNYTVQTPTNEKLYASYFADKLTQIKWWSILDVPTEYHDKGQAVNVYEPQTSKSFNQSEYAYGYVGGFDSKDVVINGKTTKAMYWKSFQMAMGYWDLNIIGPGTYWAFCEDADSLLGYVYPEEKKEAILHRCPAFTMIGKSFKESEYFGEAGRGAMFLLRPKDILGNLKPAIISGINWNGGSGFNAYGNITPYFDCFTWDSELSIDQSRNLLEKYLRMIQ